MVLLRVWPLVLVMCFASFLTNTIAWGPMPPVVEKQSGANVPFSIWMTLSKCSFFNLDDSVVVLWFQNDPDVFFNSYRGHQNILG